MYDNKLLVFHREDLCDARPKPKMSSNFKMRCTPLVEASGGQEEYYIRSSWHCEECNWECIGAQILRWDVPPVEASIGQEQYYIRYICLLISCLAVVEVSHILEYQ